LTSPSGSIRADRIWKRFRPDVSTSLIRDTLGRAMTRVRGKETTWRWALRDIDVSLDPGQSLGLIGDNGSGKSTLLKILTGIMDPTAGRLDVRGRVAALIQVTGGIHPELSGRENISLYGSILGLKRAEIARRFDEIVEFAELEDAIDRQVKFYSSGMQMRLGFTVAAYLEPDIFLVDEVLSVGDATFQEKSLGRMREVLAEGTSLVYVSHDLHSVESICEHGLWLEQGVVRAEGTIDEALSYYRHHIEQRAETDRKLGGLVDLVKVVAEGADGHNPRTQGPLDVTVTLESEKARPGRLLVGLSEGPATPIFCVRHRIDLVPGQMEARCHFERVPLPRGRYYVWVAVFWEGEELLSWHPASTVDVIGPDIFRPPPGIVLRSPVHLDLTWESGPV
jgi:ABC-2 type transport system ATP-binding protein